VSATTDDSVARPVPDERGPRGRIWLYAIAFVLLLVAGWFQARGNLLAREDLVKTSIVVSIVATIVAIVSVLVPGHRHRAASAGAPTQSAPTSTGNGSGAGSAPAAPSADPAEPAMDEEEPAAEPSSDEPEGVAEVRSGEPEAVAAAGPPVSGPIAPEDGPRTEVPPEDEDRRPGPPA